MPSRNSAPKVRIPWAVAARQRIFSGSSEPNHFAPTVAEIILAPKADIVSQYASPSRIVARTETFKNRPETTPRLRERAPVEKERIPAVKANSDAGISPTRYAI